MRCLMREDGEPVDDPDADGVDALVAGRTERDRLAVVDLRSTDLIAAFGGALLSAQQIDPGSNST